jgi:hypothetical protein
MRKLSMTNAQCIHRLMGAMKTEPSRNFTSEELASIVYGDLLAEAKRLAAIAEDYLARGTDPTSELNGLIEQASALNAAK